MKSKIRNVVMRISYSKKLELIIAFMLVVFMILAFALNYFNLKIFELVIAIIGLLIVLSLVCFDAIRRKQLEVVEKNNLINVILSDISVWGWILIWIVGYPILAMIKMIIGLNLIGAIVFGIVEFILVVILSKRLSNFFKKKLIE